MNDEKGTLPPESEDYTPDLITLLDEDGREVMFEIIDAIETENGRYMALVPVLEKPQDVLDDSGDLVIFKVLSEGEEDFLEEIQDDDEFERVSTIFVERLQDVYEFADDQENGGE